ncbi:class I SAM-dependent methyltransferase [Aeromicrobium fastidiosum]|uniref:Class I SAM-dependent methyltransferase n=1 Tax=Aeromicrobium fastidiosum TaxID=52699 RepID=A0A641AND7_9ACTN|nr:class I SAM-dependent methyltransferase [Aeromicrobium fastidiosum]KAA1376312.1 class I SAM-dependent methyltransferase [Aeromicrobium fastidiosum]MBP2391789.1 putative O-methyltransferase YrrM [Aeromicrobium fastidiosum]
MSSFDRVTETWGDLKYMNLARAKYLRDLIVREDLSDLLELGFYKGKSSAYMGAVLEDLGRGHLTTMDRISARGHQPEINEVLETVGLAHRVTPIFAHRSFTWELGRMVEQTPRPQFDFCYLDGGHTWDVTGFGFLLVDMMLKPGGIILLDDLDWSIAGSPQARTPEGAKTYEAYSDDEKAAKGVRMTFELIADHLGYDIEEVPKFQWGIARKRVPKKGLFGRG